MPWSQESQIEEAGLCIKFTLSIVLVQCLAYEKEKKKTAKKRQIDYKFALKDQIENKIKLSFFYIFEH